MHDAHGHRDLVDNDTVTVLQGDSDLLFIEVDRFPEFDRRFYMGLIPLLYRWLKGLLRYQEVGISREGKDY